MNQVIITKCCECYFHFRYQMGLNCYCSGGRVVSEDYFCLIPDWCPKLEKNKGEE